MTGSRPAERTRRGITRRGIFRLAGAGAATAGAAGLGYTAGTGALPEAAARLTGGSDAPAADDVVPFRGTHQAGIETPAQDRMHFVAFDVTTGDRAELVELLRTWTGAIERMTAGQPVGEVLSYDAPPKDTGEAMDLSAAHLTVTVGFGRSLFLDDAGRDRFGLQDRLPPALVEMPHFPGDALEERRTGGDLCVQACADDPQVAVHAIRNLARLGAGTVSVRWSQLGFGRTSSTSQAQVTPRNLFGFKDGTANLKTEEPELLARHVWASAENSEGNPEWMDGGSYLAARRIRMHIETWDRAPLREQEQIVGRTKQTGAPLSGGEEFDEPDFALAGRGGRPLVAVDSHVSVMHPSHHGGVQMLRRGYNYTDGSDGLGLLDAGLFFIAFVCDPRTHFVPLQNAMAKNDAMSEYLEHTGSGLFAVPPGVPEGEGRFLGDTLLA